MKRGLLVGIVAGVVVLALAGALFIYLTVVPDRLASGYEDRAKPEHEKIEKALAPVYRTFTQDTFGANIRAIEKADSPGEYVRALEKTTRLELRQLTPVRRAIKRAEAKLDEVDEKDLTDTPDWPLLGGRGNLEGAEEIASRESDYLRKGRRFLSEYRKLVDWVIDGTRFSRRFGVTLGRGFDAVPDNADTPAEYTRPVDAAVRELSSQVRRYKRTKAPKPMREMHRNAAASAAFVLNEVKGLSSAVKRLDLARIEQFDKRVSQGSRPYERRSRAGFKKLITRSIYVRQISDLERRETQLKRAYREL
jgi:hypothetical protein